MSDATIIEEIAKQLGMAVESTAQFLTDILPSYATMKIIGYAGSILIVMVILIAATVITMMLVKKYIKLPRENRGTDTSEPWKDATVVTVWKSVLLILWIIVVTSVLTTSMIPLFQWIFAPDAMFLQMVLNTIP